MLKKLLKYDLNYLFKFLVIFYSLAIFFGLLTRIFLSFEGSLILNIIGEVCRGASISMMFSIVINNLMRLWLRFKNNFYGDESYLTHTLPVYKKTLYLSKILTSLLTLFVSVLVIGLTLFIIYYSKENIESLRILLTQISNMYNFKILWLFLLILFVLFLEFVNALQAGFTGTIIGHKNSNKTGLSIFFGFISYLISQTAVLLIVFIVALFNKEIMNLFFTSTTVSFNTIKLVIYLSILIYSAIIIINYFINVKMFEKGVNVE